MRIPILVPIAALLSLAACSPQDQQQAREDTHKAEAKIREGAQDAGREIKKDLKVADQQLKESMEKGKEAARHAATEVRKELNARDSDTERR